MRSYKTGVLFVSLSLLLSCGRQLVEFPVDTAPEATETPAPEVKATPAPEVTATPAPEATETPAPEVTATPAPEVTETPAAEATETPAPEVTETPVSCKAPTVISTDPANCAENVSISKIIKATFSSRMYPSTISDTTFIVAQNLASIPGTVTYETTTNAAIFVPDCPLELASEYTATITSGVRDEAGTAMAEDYVWSFTTGECSLAPVSLLTADNFAVLAGSTVTNTGPTEVIGDVGVAPGTALTGFPPGTIVGEVHTGDPTASQAIADLTSAYNDVAGRTLCAVTVAGNLGGQTLAPGLYKSTSSLAISSGDLTLDAQGDSSAIFVFQMASTLTTTSGRMVILAGGARSSNVFWQVGTSASFGSTSSFQGTVLADQSITMETGASLKGALLARIGAVALDSNMIVLPLP